MPHSRNMFSRNAQFGAFLSRIQYVYQIGKISTFPKYREHHYAGYLFQEITSGFEPACLLV